MFQENEANILKLSFYWMHADTNNAIKAKPENCFAYLLNFLPFVHQSIIPPLPPPELLYSTTPIFFSKTVALLLLFKYS
jgi:hypothetical protein